MVNKGCDYFCCPRWYHRAIVSDDRLEFCGFAVVSLEGILTLIVKCGNCMRPCVVSMTTLLFPIKCNSNIGRVNFFITRKFSANTLSPISELGVTVANGFSNWPFVACFWKFGGSSISRNYLMLSVLALLTSQLGRNIQHLYCLQFQISALLLLAVSPTGHLLLVFENWDGGWFWEYYLERSVWLCPNHSGELHCHMLLNLPRHLLFVIVEIQRHIKHFLFSFQDYRRGLWEVNLISLFISHQPFLN